MKTLIAKKYSPNRLTDPHRWIPEGIYYDMMDFRNDRLVVKPTVEITNEVNWFTNLQFNNALESNVKSMPAFRTRFIQQNGNGQLTQINTLFTWYNY
jgi:hypothetical protein